MRSACAESVPRRAIAIIGRNILSAFFDFKIKGDDDDGFYFFTTFGAGFKFPAVHRVGGGPVQIGMTGGGLDRGANDFSR